MTKKADKISNSDLEQKIKMMKEQIRQFNEPGDFEEEIDEVYV